MGLVGKGVHCPTAAPEIIKRRGTIIKMFAAVFGKLPRHGLISASTHNTHTHIPYSTYTHTTYRHLYIHMCMAWYIRAFVVAVGAFN